MNKYTQELFTQGRYIREIKHLLPEAAFRPDPSKMKPLLAYLVLVPVLYLAFRLTDHLALYMILSLLIGHCLSSCGFLAHELSHRSILKANYYGLEVIAWGINLIPATVWKRVHNETHHAHLNTTKDPDRQFLASERTHSTITYTQLFYPNKKSIKWNPLVGFHFIPYIFRNILSALYPAPSKPEIVPFKPSYSNNQKLRIILELVAIVAIQMLIFYATGSDWTAYVFAGPVAYLLASTILMTYIFTNHFLNPINRVSDPLLGTTSVEVPRILNKLHFNFSYHTEHHVFPSINSNFYPALSRLLKEKYPERYHYTNMREAWSRLWRNEQFVDVTNEANLDAEHIDPNNQDQVQPTYPGSQPN